MGAFDDLPAAKGGAFDDLPSAKKSGVKKSTKGPDPLAPDFTGQYVSKWIAAGGEAALSLGTGMVGSAVGGLTGLATLDPEAIDPVAQAFAYEPRTKEGEQAAKVASYPFEKWEQFADWAGDVAMRFGATPGQATGIKTTLLFPPFIKAKGRARSAAGAAAAEKPAAEPIAQPAPKEAAPASDFPVAEEKPAVRPEGTLTRTKPGAEDRGVAAAFADLPDDIPPPGKRAWTGAPTAQEMIDRAPEPPSRMEDPAVVTERLRARTEKAEAPFRLEGEDEATFRARMLRENQEREAAKARDSAPPAEEFTLAGSDRPTDQVAARGQMELGEAPPRQERKIYRGYGRTDQKSVYNEGSTGVPIAGEARYYSFGKEEAQRYGPNIEEKALDLENPLVITDGKQWSKLTKDAGWKFPNPSGTLTAEQAARLKEIVRERGHDGIVVDWDTSKGYDIGPRGEDWKLLGRVFDYPQVIDYRAAPAQAPKARPREAEVPSAKETKEAQEREARRRSLAGIHIRAKEVGLEGDEYRKFLKDLTGVESAKDLSAEQRQSVLAALRSRPAKKPAAAKASEAPDQKSASENLRKALDYRQPGQVSFKKWAAAHADYLKEAFGVDAIVTKAEEPELRLQHLEHIEGALESGFTVPKSVLKDHAPIDATQFPRAAKLAETTPAAPREGAPVSLLTAIKRKGGIDVREILDLTGEGRAGKKGIQPGLFTKKGTGLDDLATRLRDDGFDIPMDTADGGVQALRDMIQDELAGRQKHYSAYDQDRIARAEQAERDKDLAREESTLGEQEFLNDEEALAKFGPGTLGMNAALNPDLIRQAARDMKAGAAELLNQTFGTPGAYRNLYGPIRDLEQTNVARIDRWAAGESFRIKEAFPSKSERRDLTERLVRGNLTGLTGIQLEVAKKLQQNYAAMGEYAIRAQQLESLRQNYSPQIWDLNDSRTRRMIQMWRDARDAGPIRETSPLLRDPSGSGMFSPFKLQRAISDVFEGMQMGLKPASMDAAELFTTYARSMGRSVERAKSMKSLMELMSDQGDPMVMPEKQAPRGYEAVRYPELEGYRVHPDIAPAVKVVLETDTPGAIGIALQSAAYASKRGLVSYSFFHPMSLFLAWEGSFPKGSMLNPKGAIDAALKRYREGGPGDAVDKLLEGGLKLGAPMEDLMGRERFGSLMDKVERVANKVHLGGVIRVPRAIDRKLQYATWDYVQTGFKLDLATRFYEDQLLKNADRIAKGEITDKDIARQAAEAANGIQGGLNWERMIDKFDTPAGRRIMADILSKNGRRWAQTFAFAPDWLVSTVSTWTNAVTGGEKAAVRRALARRYLITSAIITYTYGNALNYYFTGHSMFENRSNKKDANWLDDMKAKTEVQLGGGLRINPNKHFLEVPHMVADPIAFALNKANPLTVGEPIEQLWNKQWMSTGYAPPIVEKQDKGLTRARKRLQHVAGKVVPITGRSVMEHGALGGGGFLGFPVSGVSEEERERERTRKAIERSSRP